MVKKTSVLTLIYLGLVTNVGLFWEVTKVAGALVRSQTEKEALEKFRSLVEPDLYQDFMKQDEYLLRWLKDQKFDVEKAQRKLLATLKWRKENRIDSVGNETFPEFAHVCTFSLNSRDREGIPVLTSSLGACPIRRLLLSGTLEKYRRYNIQALEKMQILMQKVDVQRKDISKAVGIVDLSGFSWREHACLQCLPFQQEQFTINENYYPEFYKRLFLINTPRAFENLIAIIRPFLSEHSIETLNIYGFNKEEWSKEIRKFIDPQQLTPQFGGTKKL